MDKKFATLNIEGQEYKLPIVLGSENEKALDISNLRQDSGYITSDIGYQNTGSALSSITFIDGEKGVMRYRGYAIEELAEKSNFTETAYLLIYGKFPNQKELSRFSVLLTENSLIHEDMLHFFDGIPITAHPMATLSSMINVLSVYYPGFYVEEYSQNTFDVMVARLISKVRTIAAFSYKKSIGEPFVYPRHDKKYVPNFLNMMFSSPVKPYELNPILDKALNTLLLIHADHEQNCSTSTVRLVGSSKVNLYSSVCAGICALWGPLHGGANQKVIEMLEEIVHHGWTIEKVVEMAKDKKNPFVLSGFGHRVYKNYDPRARILKNLVKEVFDSLNIQDPILDIALELEEFALSDPYFIERKLYPNVDFYSGILYRAMGIPTNMFTVMFAIGRLPGWIAQWREMHDFKPFKIGRPRQIYTGPTYRPYVPLSERV